MKSEILLLFFYLIVANCHFSIQINSEQICKKSNGNIFNGIWTNEKGDVIEINTIDFIGFLDDPYQPQRFFTGWYRPRKEYTDMDADADNDDEEEVHLYGTFSSSEYCQKMAEEKNEISLENDHVVIENQ